MLVKAKRWSTAGAFHGRCRGCTRAAGAGRSRFNITITAGRSDGMFHGYLPRVVSEWGPKLARERLVVDLGGVAVRN